jgi:hypothetical protein
MLRPASFPGIFTGIVLMMGWTCPVTAEDRCVEVSADGQSTAFICADEQTKPWGVRVLGSGVPFGTMPDWQNTLRRQVASVHIADIDADGDNDIVVGCFTGNSFPPYTDWHNFIHRVNDGVIEQNPSWISSDQVHTGDFVIGHLNNDNFVDIFSANGGSSHSPSVIYYGGPSGPATSPGWSSTTPLTTWATSSIGFDFDHDGDLDIVTTNQSAIQSNPYRPIWMYKQNAGVVETTPSWASTESSIQNGLDVGDFDGDGWEDLAVAKWVDFFSGIYKSNGGNLQTTPIWTSPTTGGSKGAAFGDVDGDTDLDVAFGADPSQLWTNTAGSFANTWTSTAASPSVQELMLHDVDGDGDKDVAEIHFSTGRCHIYLNNNGVIDTAPSWTYDSTQVGNALAFGDLNGDRRDDLAIGFSGDNSVAVFYAEVVCPADIDNSGTVNVADLLAVIAAWGAVGANPADITGDQIVNVADLLAVIGAWGAC